MTINVGIVSYTINLVLFGTICVAATVYHGSKKLTNSKQQCHSSADKRRKLVVISGCDRGFGRLLAEALNTSGNDYLILALTLTEASALELLSKGDEKGKLFAIKCDVTSKSDVANMKAFAEKMLDEHDAVLYGIVNNAGIVSPGDFVWYSDTSVYQNVMDVNYFGQLRVTHALLPFMLRTSNSLSSGPRIVNLSSVCGTMASPSNGAYSASKFAVEAWSDSIRLELRPFNVHVVKVRPGQISTDIQVEYGTNLVENFKNAPEGIQQIYGGEKYLKSIKEPFQAIAESSANGSMQHPSIVTQSLEDILAIQDTSKIKPYYWIGSDAHTFFKAMYNLPTTVSDTIKQGLVHFAPFLYELPTPDAVSHLTIKVKSIDKSIVFYRAFGFKEFGKMEHGMQFLVSGKAKWWSTLILLQEDTNFVGHKESYGVGMTRLCLFSTNFTNDVKMLKEQGLQPMGPIATLSSIKVAAYLDPDSNFVVYYFGFGGPVRLLSQVVTWWKQKSDPIIFHWTINCFDVKHAMSVFEKLDFKTTSDQRSDQVGEDLLAAFNIEKNSTVIEHIRICKLPKDSVFATLMEWKTPKSESNPTRLANTMTIAVSNVSQALEKARGAGMVIPTEGAITYQTLPVYGKVKVGTAYLENESNRIEFCCFADKKF